MSELVDVIKFNSDRNYADFLVYFCSYCRQKFVFNWALGLGDTTRATRNLADAFWNHVYRKHEDYTYGSIEWDEPYPEVTT